MNPRFTRFFVTINVYVGSNVKWEIEKGAEFSTRELTRMLMVSHCFVNTCQEFLSLGLVNCRTQFANSEKHTAAIYVEPPPRSHGLLNQYKGSSIRTCLHFLSKKRGKKEKKKKKKRKKKKKSPGADRKASGRGGGTTGPKPRKFDLFTGSSTRRDAQAQFWWNFKFRSVASPI